MLRFNSNGRHALTQQGVMFTLSMPEPKHVYHIVNHVVYVDDEPYKVLGLTRHGNPKDTLISKGEVIGLHCEQYVPIELC